MKRSKRINIHGLNDQAQEIVIDTNGMLARVFQHEMDHLNGLIILDHVSQLRRDMYKRKLNKILKRGK